MARASTTTRPARPEATHGTRTVLLERLHPVDIHRAPVYVVGTKPLPFGHHILLPGVEVPGAANWSRLEAWVSARRVRLAGDFEEYTSYDDFVASQPQPEPAVDVVTPEAASDQQE